MLGKISINGRALNKEIIASNAIQQDFVSTFIAPKVKRGVKPWQESCCPPAPESPFGDFPAILKGPKARLTASSDPIRRKKSPSGARQRRPVQPTEFRKAYERGVIPIKIQHTGTLNKIEWESDPREADLKFLLPLFVDGLKEKLDPFRFLAILGSLELIECAETQKLLECLALIIMPIKTALNTRDEDIIVLVCKFLQKLLISHQALGKFLVPYYRQLLPIFNIFKTRNSNIRDKIEYSQRLNTNVGDIIDETLGLMEVTGGKDAFINIKYLIPTYESCVYK